MSKFFPHIAALCDFLIILDIYSERWLIWTCKLRLQMSVLKEKETFYVPLSLRPTRDSPVRTTRGICAGEEIFVSYRGSTACMIKQANGELNPFHFLYLKTVVWYSRTDQKHTFISNVGLMKPKDSYNCTRLFLSWAMCQYNRFFRIQC